MKPSSNPSHHGFETRSATAHGQVEYTCPMHSQVRQRRLGSCPICGMALEPVVTSAETAESSELLERIKRFWVGLVLTVPLFIMEMGADRLNLHAFMPQISNWVHLGLATPVVFWSSWPI